MTPQLLQIVPDAAVIERFVTWLFEFADPEGGIIAMRGLGEKGTDGEGVFRDNAFEDMDSVNACVRHALRWCEHGRGCFIVPAIVSHEARLQRNATEQMMKAFTTILVDVDEGDTIEKLEWAAKHIGPPSMLVQSGGRTTAGKPKYHAYWRLSEPCYEVERLSAVRTSLAQKIGADGAFGRSTQVIRVPGTIHNKNNTPKMVEIAGVTGRDYHFDDLAEAIEDMPEMPGVERTAVQTNVLPFPAIGPDGVMDFSAGAGLNMVEESRVPKAMTEFVREGGVDEDSRWARCGVVIGEHIRRVREGLETREQALEHVLAWNEANCIQPLPEAKVRMDFHGLWNVDIKNHGPMPEAPAPVPIEVQAFQHEVRKRTMIDTADKLLEHAVHRWTNYDPPPRRWFVNGLIHAKKKHMLVSEGGAGKSNLLMDLAIKMVIASPERKQHWMGQPIGEAAYGGTVVLLTGEDGREELDHRWKSLDPTGEARRECGDRLIAVAFEDAGGAYPFVESDPHTKRDRRSPDYAALLKAMTELHERGQWMSAVIVDTLNTTLHGEENSANIVGEYIRAVTPICGEFGAAFILAHHAKKVDSDAPVKNLDDMKTAVRGSSALINAMRVVIGLWHDHKYAATMKAMGMRPEREKMYCAGVVKSNVPADAQTHYMLKDVNGVLQDVTGMVQQALARNQGEEAKAWIAFGIEQLAEQQLYLNKSGANAMHEHIHMFHPSLHEMSRNALWKLVDEMLKEKKLVKRSIPGMGNRSGFLDTAANANMPRDKPEDDLAVTPIDYGKWTYNDRSGRVEAAPQVTLQGG